MGDCCYAERRTYPYRRFDRFGPCSLYSSLSAAKRSSFFHETGALNLYMRAEFPLNTAVFTGPSAGPSGPKPNL